MRRKLALTVAGVAAAVAPLLAAAPSEGVVVPNYIECSYQTGNCVQQNGAYDRRYRTDCHWVYRPIWANNRSQSLCDRWV